MKKRNHPSAVSYKTTAECWEEIDTFRLAHRHGRSETEIDDLVDMLSILAETVEPLTADAPETRDEKDQPVLGPLMAAKRAGSVDYLISGDKDLLVLAPSHPIVTPAEFWTAHGR